MKQYSKQRSKYICNCKISKKYRLFFDGGSTGKYLVELCKNCYDLEDKQFLLSEEKLGETY